MINESQEAQLFAPLPKEALSQHPSRSYLTVISPIYVIERLNEVFGVGAWIYKTEPIQTNTETKFAVVKGILEIPAHNIHIEQYGGNDNKDLGDAYKGAATDALTKIASYLGIGFDVYKGKGDKPSQPNNNDFKI